MTTFRLGGALVGVGLLAISCGGGGGQTGAAGSSGRGAAGGTGGGQAGGSAGGSASCPNVSPCGGDVVGTWTVTQSCLTGSQDLSNVCAGASAEVDYMITGTVTFNADGTFSSSSPGGSIVIHDHYPSGCKPEGLTCDQLGQLAPDGGRATITCATDSTGACNCVETIASTAGTTSGTYSRSGDSLTTSHDGGTGMGSYCVQGGLLYEMAGPPMDGGLPEMGYLVFTKQ
jgi:hypothetical protein